MIGDYARGWHGPFDEHRAALDRIEHVEFIRWFDGARL